MRNYERDYKEIPKFAQEYKGKTVLSCIDDYAKKMKIVDHRVSKVVWGLIDDGVIEIQNISGIYYII